MSAPDTAERYRVSVASGGQRYKLLAHQVLEDETLSVEVRSKPLKRHALSGSVALDDGLLTIVPDSAADERSAHHVHYHPSGQVRVKAIDGAVIRELSFPPLAVLHAPLPLLSLSVASLQQLDIDDRKPSQGDAEINLDQMPVERLEASAWIGPKGSLKKLEPLHRPAQKWLYEDAGLYDFAYIVGQSAPIKDLRVAEHASLRDTRITSFLDRNIPPNHEIPTRDPEYWSTPPAVARQLRATLESQFDFVKAKLAAHDAPGAWEVRMSLCRDGVIAALDWNYTWRHPGYSFVAWFHLTVEHVLGVLKTRGTDAQATDVFDIKPDLTGSRRGICFVRSTMPARDHSLHNAVVLRPIEHLQQRYYRIPRVVVTNLTEILSLVA